MNRITVIGLVFIALLGFSSAYSQDESLTITTYYPSPAGSYRELRSTKVAIGDTYIDRTEYSWETGATNKISAEADLVVEGRVGIGTAAPQAPLTVASEANTAYPNPGLTPGGIHIIPIFGDNGNTGAITWGYNNAVVGTNSAAGIYVQSSGSYGTKMHFATTDDYDAGTKGRMMIDHLGNVGIGTITPRTKATGSGYLDVQDVWLRDANQWASQGKLNIQSRHDVSPHDQANCDGDFSGGLCLGSFFQDITFDPPFQDIPHVIVVPEHISNQGGCVGQATDQVKAYPALITRTGFRLYVNGSPVPNSCGTSEGWSSVGKAGWLAIGY